MAEMLIQSESLTPIADQIRVLSGTEDAMSLDDMETHVGEANEDVATEADLIAQIASALEGKAAGGSGGSDSGTIETCNVTLDIPKEYNLIYQYIENGEICCMTVYAPFPLDPTLQQAMGLDTSHVVKNSFIICGKSVITTTSDVVSTTGNVEIVGADGSSATGQKPNTCGYVFKIKGDCSITITE